MKCCRVINKKTKILFKFDNFLVQKNLILLKIVKFCLTLLMTKEQKWTKLKPKLKTRLEISISQSLIFGPYSLLGLSKVFQSVTEFQNLFINSKTTKAILSTICPCVTVCLLGITIFTFNNKHLGDFLSCSQCP